MSDHTGKDSQDRWQEGTDASLAKLCMPRLAKGVVRARLFDLLDAARQKAAIWVVAPGGAGKTTLTATYIIARQLPHMWYQVDKNDADPATFFYYLGLAAKAFAAGKDSVFPLLTPEYLPDIMGFARRYFRNLYSHLPRGSLLVLDNHQDLADADVFNGILRSAIDEVPAESTLIIISRTNPPPELARHQVGGMLEIVSWDAIRLTMEETAAIASSAGELDETVIRSLHERCEGWAAGLTLLLEQIKTNGLEDKGVHRGDLGTIFDFFASEYFDHLPGTTRDFLLKTAFLQHITPVLAEEITANRDGDKILADFHRRHFFTNRWDAPEVTYQYHALFREFLLARAEQTYSRSQYLKLSQEISQILGKYGLHEDAVALCLHARHWEMASSIILAQAPVLLAQGRAQIIAGWIQQLPEENVESNLWLLYWRGVSLQFSDPLNAKEILESAYGRFADKRGITGQLMTASAIIDIVYIMRGSLLAATHWVEVLQDQLMENPEFPSPAMEARVLSSLTSMLELMCPSDPRLPHYVERLGYLLEYDLDVNDKVLIAGRLIIYHAVISGNVDECTHILRYVRPLLKSPQLTTAIRFNWMMMSVLPFLMADCRSEVARESVDMLLGMVKDGSMREQLESNNLAILEFITSYYAVLLFLHLDSTVAAKSLLDRMETLISSPQSIDMAVFTMTKSLCALVQGDFHAARKYGETSLEVHSSVGAMITQLEVSCIVAIERCESDRPEEALGCLALPKEKGLGNSPRMRYQVLLIESYAHLLQGDMEQCHARLRDAVAVGRDHHYWGSAFWLTRILPRLCSEALRCKIEVDYIRRLISMRGLLPEDSSVEDWPWPVRIYTLGQFKLVIDDEPFDVQTKAQNKPLSLLEVLIGLGGTSVKRERIADVLWPDSEADAALFTFTTTLARLRKIIGENAISVKNGRVSLNERVCWVDVRALERHFDEADNADLERVAGGDLVNKIMALYRGPFLHDEEGQWAKRVRNQLRSKFSRLVAHYCRSLHEAGHAERAVGVLRRALEIDPDCEEYFQGLVSDDTFSG